jgi:RND family efflux transporter MFP subunit
MKYLINILILIALLVLIGLKLKENKEIVQKRVFKYNKENPINIHAEKVSLSNAVETQFVTGNFMPSRQARINSEMQGKITAIYVDLGSNVKKGQKLLKIDDNLLRLQLNTLDVKIEGLKTDIKRFKVLTKADAIQAVKLEKAELGLKSAKVQRSTILEKIRKTVVYAPFSGVITGKMTEIGSFAAPQMPLFQLIDINNLKFTVNVPENDLELFKLNTMHPVLVDAYQELQLTGKTIMIGAKVNEGNSYPVQFEVKNTKDLKIKSGMFGKIELSHSSNKPKIVIFATSIVGSNVQPKVYVVENGKAKLKNVVISRRIGDKVVIEEGLKDGDTIVTSGFINLFDGANVTF